MKKHLVFILAGMCTAGFLALAAFFPVVQQVAAAGEQCNDGGGNPIACSDSCQTCSLYGGWGACAGCDAATCGSCAIGNPAVDGWGIWCQGPTTDVCPGGDTSGNACDGLCCTTFCAQGQSQCSGNSVVSCALNSSGCFDWDWANPSACGTGTTCIGGACQSTPTPTPTPTSIPQTCADLGGSGIAGNSCSSCNSTCPSQCAQGTWDCFKCSAIAPACPTVTPQPSVSPGATPSPSPIPSGNLLANNSSTCPAVTFPSTGGTVAPTGYTWDQDVGICNVSGFGNCSTCEGASGASCLNFSSGICSCGGTGNILGQCCQTANPLYYASQQTAQLLATCLGGTLAKVDFLAPGGPYMATEPMYVINFSNGQSVIAGFAANYYNRFSQSVADRSMLCEITGCNSTAVTTGDTMLPIVSLTAPMANSVVKGTVAISANAADNVAVAGVTFLVGTQQIGDDTTVPYGISWNSTAVADGISTIQAQARDAAGNKSAVSQVNVSISNHADLPPPPPPTSVTTGQISCLNPTVPAGWASPCPAMRVSSDWTIKSGSLDITVTPLPGSSYVYKTIYFSDSVWNCPGKVAGAWCPMTLPGAAATGASAYTTVASTLTLTSATLSNASLGTHFLAQWDWTWNTSQNCWFGPGGTSCIFQDAQGNITNIGGATWRFQQFSLN